MIPRALAKKEVAHWGLTDLRIVPDMHERKATMYELSEGFIALPGGIGTLEEFFEVLTWTQLGMHSKPCGLLNVAGYYDSLLEFLDHTVDEEFLKETHRQMILAAETPAALLTMVEEHRPPDVSKWVDPVSS